ncbi:MAG TPA: vitamin B12-dependent ribonucleotide reductase [Pirellulales bacterium]|nr:vitamin B12-dependent ribonucleotide reductase [Pirellulales bacterium]
MATATMDVSTRSLFDQRDRGDKIGGRGLRFDPVFCDIEIEDPFQTVQWEQRSAEIRGESGDSLFEQHDCEIPAGWSQLATNVVVSKYFYGEVGTAERENSVRQLIHRVTRTIADWGIEDGYFASPQDGETFYRDLTWLCLHQHGAFNSPVWFNVGLFHQYKVEGSQCNWRWNPEIREASQPENPYEFPQASACFIQSVNDDMEAIMRLATSEAMLFKFGSGTGTDLSTLRSHREKLSGGGKPSGPLSFMRVYDQIAAVVKSGGKTRRAAKMQSLKVWHPDIMEFIDCKAKEEAKARVLIEKGGYDPNFNGEAYSSIMFQNANLSVRVTDDYMNAVLEDCDWTTRWVTNQSVAGPTYGAREIMQRMAQNAWQCGDPGVQYDTTINRWHTCPNSGRINASNPCSEYMFLDDTACNLASINLMKFGKEDGSFDTERFEQACRAFFVAQEILVDHASYPTKTIAENSHRFRPLGLGYSNLGSLLMTSGHPYDSDESYGICGAITALLHGAGNLASIEMAAALGPFDGYETNRDAMLGVMRMHRDAVENVNGACPDALVEAARQLWDRVLEHGEQFGFRNAQATVLAPTGTISFLMDCDTTGIEPDIALVKYKQLAGGGMLKIVNQAVPAALTKLGYDQPQIESITAYIDQNDKIEGAPALKDEDLPVFDCAFEPPGGGRSIEWRSHIRMMAAAQPFLSGAISKTVNMPSTITADEVAEAYTWGWRLGLKALAIYRDGSKQSQPLATSTEADRADQKLKSAPRRDRLPDTRNSITHKFSIDGHEGYLNVGLYADGRPGEVFITMAKEGSTIGGLMDSFGTATSICLQYGVPLEVLINKFSHTRFDPMGFTKNPDVRYAKSIVDYIFRWLGCQFIPGYREANLGIHVEEDSAVGKNSAGASGSGKKPGYKEDESESATRPVAKEAGGQTNGHGTTAKGEKTNGRSRHEHRGNGSDSPGSNTNSSEANVQARQDRLEQAGMSDGSHSLRSDQFSKFQTDAPLCGGCGAISVRCGNCYLCYNCGNSMGCS